MVEEVESKGLADQTGLIASGISLSFGGQKVLDSVDIHLEPGRVHAITGENGAGKSSLAKVIAGIYRSESGSISFNRADLRLKDPRSALRQGITLIHQEPLIFPDLSIGENIFAGNLPKRGPKIDWDLVYQRSRDLLDKLGSNLDVRTSAGTLSIADQQMLEIAAAMSYEAKVWIFDETTAPLTPTEVARLFGLINELKQQGCAIGIVTHHMDEVFTISDDITVLRNGKKVVQLLTQNTTKNEVVSHMVGRDLDNQTQRTERTDQEIAFQIQNATGPGFQAVDFTIHRGEIFGVAGLVGAGRTELARAIFGITKPTSGQLKLDGQPYEVNNPGEAIKAGVVLVPEDRRGAGLCIEQSILDNTTLPGLKRFASKIGILSRNKAITTVQPKLDDLATKYQSLDQPVGQLSGGNQQKVVLTKWLLEEPKLLILDEPTRGVDIGAKADVHRQIRHLASQGVAILLISSDLPEVLSLSDRIGVMRKGEIVGTLAAAEATEALVVSLASGGQA